MFGCRLRTQYRGRILKLLRTQRRFVRRVSLEGQPGYVTAWGHLLQRSPVATQKYSHSHITAGEAQAQRGSASASRSNSGNEPQPSSVVADLCRVRHCADSRTRFATFCTPTPRERFLGRLAELQATYRTG